MNDDELARRFETVRGELEGYLLRLVAIPEQAEEVAQAAALRALSNAESAPEPDREFRAWVFRIATNIAIDELRRAGRWRNGVMPRLRGAAESDAPFVAFSGTLRGDPEMRAIAREHLAVCFSCTTRNLEPDRAAVLLLREVFGFTLEESAAVLDSRPAQIKNRLQEARRSMSTLYGTTCALVAKQGVCYQCVELDEYFNGGRENPLGEERDPEEERLQIVRELGRTTWNVWHRALLGFIDES